MHQPQSTSTTRFALAPRHLAALAPAARERFDWRGDDVEDLGREERSGQGAFARKEAQRWKGLLPWQVKRVSDYVDAGLHGRVSLSMAAGHARLSPNYFSRCFRRSFGVTFSRFVSGRRVERAQGLMIGGVDKLSQIALACGFADQAHFTRTFGDHLGCPPSRWRRQAAMSRLPIQRRAGLPRASGLS